MPPVMQSREQDQLRRSTNIYGRTQIYGRDRDFPAYAVRRAREAFFNPFSAGSFGFLPDMGIRETVGNDTFR